MAARQKFMLEFRNEGLELLRDAQEHGGIDATTLVKILDLRRELLTTHWELPIWRELGGLYLKREKKLLRQLNPVLIAEEGYSIESRGIFFPVKGGSSIRWCGLLRPQIGDKKEIVKEASWCRVTYAPVGRVTLDLISAAEVALFYGRAFDVLRWIKEAVEQSRGELEGTVGDISEIEDMFFHQEWIYTGPVLDLEMQKRHPEIDFKLK